MVELLRAALDRRNFLTGSGLLLGALATGALTSCATSSPRSSGATPTAGAVSAENPFGVVDSGSVEVAVPTSGFGTEWIKLNGDQFNELYPNVEVVLTEVQDMKTTMQPRFVQGDTPDWIFPSGLDLPGLASQGQMTDLTEFYESEAPGFDGATVKDVLLPGAYELGLLNDGQPLTLNYTYLVQGIWYSKKLFDEHGWQEPTTVDEFYALCEEIKAAGIAPMAYQGQYPNYLMWHLAVMAAKEGGREVLDAIHALEPDAWQHPAVLAAAGFYEEMRSRGFFLEGTEGLDHTQSQTYWAQGKAAFIPCGGWLEAEMGDLIPADFGMTVMTAPSVKDGGAMPAETIVAQAYSAMFVPTEAKNPAAGLEFMRQLVSKEAAQRFTELTKSMVAVKDYLDEGTEISPGFDTQRELVEDAGENVVSWRLATIDPRLGPEIDGALGELARGALTAQQFCDRAQELTDAAAKA